jgi:hypothetical protein
MELNKNEKLLLGGLFGVLALLLFTVCFDTWSKHEFRKQKLELETLKVIGVK